MQRRPFSHPKTPRWAKGTSTWNCTICKKMLIRWRVCLFYLNPQLGFPCAASGYCANHLFSYWHYSICNMPYGLTYTCHLGTAHLWRNCCGYLLTCNTWRNSENVFSSSVLSKTLIVMGLAEQTTTETLRKAFDGAVAARIVAKESGVSKRSVWRFLKEMKPSWRNVFFPACFYFYFACLLLGSVLWTLTQKRTARRQKMPLRTVR